MAQDFQTEHLRGLKRTQRKAERTATALIWTGHWFGWITVAGGCVVLLAYALDIGVVWRPLPNGASTHPITAMLFILAGLAVVLMKPMRTPPGALLLISLVGLAAICRLVEMSGDSIFDPITPFQSILLREVAAGEPVGFGWKSATMFTLVAAAFAMRYLGWPILSQIVAAFALAPSLISLTGYLYGIADFYGAMSPTTAVIGLFLAAAPLLLSARTGIVRAISSPWDSGRFGRMEITIIGVAIFLGGYLVHAVGMTTDISLMPLFVVTSILIATTTISFSTITTDRNDRERRRGERTISHLVLHDSLSGLYNRRFFQEQKDALVGFAKRQNFRVCVLMVDIDHFKRVNDTFGHLVGDQVIRRVAQALRTRLRRSDVAVRYGGEELLAVVLDATLNDAVKVGEDIRAAIASTSFSDLGISSPFRSALRRSTSR